MIILFIWYFRTKKVFNGAYYNYWLVFKYKFFPTEYFFKVSEGREGIYQDIFSQLVCLFFQYEIKSLAEIELKNFLWNITNLYSKTMCDRIWAISCKLSPLCRGMGSNENTYKKKRKNLQIFVYLFLCECLVKTE